MTVQQIIDLATTGVLKNLANLKNEPLTVLGFLNLGLIEIYKKFPVKIEEHIITLDPEVEIYTMPSDFMWMIGAYGEVPENVDLNVVPVAINEEDNPLSINTIGWNKVQIPVTVEGGFISIIYAASPKYLTEADLASTLDVPAQMVEALLSYIGYSAYRSFDGKGDSENSNYYRRFEVSCSEIEKKGMFTSDDLNMTDKFKSKVWA